MRNQTQHTSTTNRRRRSAAATAALMLMAHAAFAPPPEAGPIEVCDPDRRSLIVLACPFERVPSPKPACDPCWLDQFLLACADAGKHCFLSYDPDTGCAYYDSACVRLVWLEYVEALLECPCK